MATIESAISEWQVAIESIARTLRGVSTQLEAQFDLIYDGSSDPVAKHLNPARIAARLETLKKALPEAVADVISLSREELNASRELQDSALTAANAALMLDAIVPHDGGEQPSETLAIRESPETSFHSELTALVTRITEASRAAQHEYSRLISAENTDGLLSNDALDQEYQKCLSRMEMHAGEPLQNSNEPHVQPSEMKALESCPGRDSEPPKFAEGKSRSSANGGEKATAVTNKENAAPKVCSAGSRERSMQSKSVPKGRTEQDVLTFEPIAKLEYQRLAPNLKRQAKLQELNDVYEKVFLLLSARGTPMPEDQLISACGEESSKKLDVLRRGFALLKLGPQGWSLRKAVPGQAAGKSRARLAPGSSGISRMASD